jgi:hypothetical protein
MRGASTIRLPVGTLVDYVFSRDPRYDGDAEGATILFRGVVKVESFPQARTALYDYSLEATGGATPLPDTAIPAATRGR